MKLSSLKDYRERKGMSQQELSEVSGVARDGISRYESGSRDARPSTARRLANALEVEVTDLIEMGKVKLELGAPDRDGVYRGEVVRFIGEEIDRYEERDVTFALFECPGGYRVYVEDGSQPASYLHPHDLDSSTLEYGYSRLYTSEEVAQEFPAFGSSVGRMRVRDLD